jgi:hypothetical protein
MAIMAHKTFYLRILDMVGFLYTAHPLLALSGFSNKIIDLFTNADPCIDYGGFFGESKIDILKQIPAQYLPQTIFITKGCSFDFVLEQIKMLEYPLICKPNVEKEVQR